VKSQQGDLVMNSKKVQINKQSGIFAGENKSEK
jgi:hypothetical protein